MNELTRVAMALAVSMALALTSSVVAGADGDDRLTAVFSSDLVANGATTSRDGRLFLAVQPTEPGAQPQVVEVRDGVTVAYPTNQWNGWRPGMDGHGRFVGVNSIRVGPDGDLWAVDRGSPGGGQPLVPGGAKLVRINLATNDVARVYDLSGATRPWSFVDDVRFNGAHAYLTDAGAPGLIVLNLESGVSRRILEGHPSTVAQSPLMAEGKPLISPTGQPVNIHADQLEVSPNGDWLYYQPASGGLARIATGYLDDPGSSEAQLAAHVERVADTPSTGGTAIDANGTIYFSDVDTDTILTVSPTGQIGTLISDPRLSWVDAMWIDDAGNLLMPAAQINRLPQYDGGTNGVKPPITLYRINIGQPAVRN